MSRLYTSVIPPNPEKCGPKVSWSTDMSPTTSFSLAALPVYPLTGLAVLSLVYPGWGMRVGTWEGYTGYYPPSSQDPYLVIFHHILALRPYLRPNEGELTVIYEVSEIGS